MTRVVENRKWRCESCDKILKHSELLVAKHPFDEIHKIFGCPACLEIGFALVCDEQDCVRDGNCGWPTRDDTDEFGGYRNTCYEHSEWGTPK